MSKRLIEFIGICSTIWATLVIFFCLFYDCFPLWQINGLTAYAVLSIIFWKGGTAFSLYVGEMVLLYHVWLNAKGNENEV